MSDLRVTCAGGLNVDRILRLGSPAVLGSSNPGVTNTAPGGVARNIAERLVRSGVSTTLFGAVGEDGDGRLLLEHAAKIGLDVSAVATVANPTGTYTAIIDPGGGLVIGVSDMAATESLTVDHVAAVAPHIARSAWLVIDGNLPTEVLAALTEMAHASGCKIAANAVSVAKAPRLRNLSIDLLFCSLDEAESLAGNSQVDADLKTAEHCRSALSTVGIPAAVITVGADGAWYYDSEYYDSENCGTVAAIPTDAADTTGAGDALVGETIRRLMAGDDLRAAVSAGVAVASEVIKHVGATEDQTTPRANP